MTNILLRQALADAKMTTRDLASSVGVDEKTVERWVRQNCTPHPRHRWAAAEALGVDETVLWPDSLRSAIKTGVDREIVSVYPDRAACPKSLWRDLINRTEQRMTFAGYTNYFLWLDVSDLPELLRQKASQGVSVRFLVGDPDSAVTRAREAIEAVTFTVSTRIRITLDEVAKLRESGIRARLSDRHIATSVFQFDRDMLVSVHLADQLGHASPTLHLRQRSSDGIYDRFARHVEHLWEHGSELSGSSDPTSPRR